MDTEWDINLNCLKIVNGTTTKYQIVYIDISHVSRELYELLIKSW